MAAYFNEIDPYAAAWLRNLIAAGHIADGEVDERSIEDVRPDDLRGFTQCHFFAGLGGWPLAFRLAGWPDDRPVWSGCAPCQPFSAAGAGLGFADERPLWPLWHWLITQCRPSEIFGEQVASKDVEPWLDLVFTDLEAAGYACGADPFPSASVGAPHIRDRAYFVAAADYARSQGRRGVSQRRGERTSRSSSLAGRLADTHGRQRDGIAVIRGAEPNRQDAGRSQGGREFESRGAVCALADADSIGHAPRGDGCPTVGYGQALESNCGSGELGDADSAHERRERRGQGSAAGSPEGEICGQDEKRNGSVGDRESAAALDAAGPTNGFWRVADWLFCRDEKWRR